MGFLHPTYLFAALAALVPLLIHLLHRQRVIIIEFPSLAFLRALLRKRTRRFQLRQLLALILRMSFVLLLALALSHPTLRRKVTGGGHIPTAAAIIIDDTSSMMREKDGIDLIEIAKRKAKQILSYFNPSDQVSLFLVSGAGEEISTDYSDLKSLSSAIDGISCKKQYGLMWQAIEGAFQVLSKSDLPNKEIYLISDMQESTWVRRGRLRVDFEADLKDAKVIVIDLGENTPNTCIGEVVLRIPVSGATLSADVPVQRFGSPDERAQLVEVYVKGGLSDRAVFSASSGIEIKHFELPRIEGFLWGEVRTIEDSYRFDDRRYFALSSSPIKIGVVGDSKYISAALDPKGEGRFSVTTLLSGEIGFDRLKEFDGLVLSNVARLSRAQIGAISDFVQANRGLVIFLGSEVDVGFYNRYLLPQFGSVTIEGLVSAGSAGFFTIDKVLWEHPIFRRFSRQASPFAESVFSRFFRINAGNGKVLAWFSDGSAAVVEPRESVIIFSTSADGQWNDLVLTGQFVPVMHETQAYVCSRAATPSSFLIGDEIVFKSKGSIGEIIIDGPTGETRLFPDIAQGGQYSVRLPEEPGIFFIRTDSETLSVVAVNVDTRESDLTKVSQDLVESVFRNADLKILTEVDDIQQSISGLREGKDLRKHMLWIAFGLLIGESLVASTLFSSTTTSETSDEMKTWSKAS